MPRVTNVKLTGRRVNATEAELTISWTTTFVQQEILSKTIFVYDVYLQNVDGVGDLDIRRRRLGTAWDLAVENPIDREAKYKVSRSFLNEDFQVAGFGDTTDEWIAEVKASPFTPAADTAKSAELRMEFGP